MSLDGGPFTAPFPADGGGGDACPPVERFERWHAGMAASDEAARLRAHLERCPECARVWDGITAEPLDAITTREPPPGGVTRSLVDKHAADVPPSEPSPEPVPAIEGFDRFEEIGRGGMGVVWRAREVPLDRAVAIKVLSTVAALSTRARARAEQEARTLARLALPNVVRVFGLTSCGGAPAIVMEWIEGPSLAESARTKSFPMREAAALVRTLAEAVTALHAAGIVHRDITPANVLMADGTPPRPVLIDFGIAAGETETVDHGTQGAFAVGTPGFMAPEQTGLDAALGPVGPATDIHALGALLYWLLSGKAPYEGRTTLDSLERAASARVAALGRTVAGVPADLGTIVSVCLERRPERRYRSAAALADDLGRFLEGRPILARGAGVVERVVKWARRQPVAAALVVTALVAAGATAAGVLHHRRSLEVARRELLATRDEAMAAARLARESFDRLTDASAARLLARGGALDTSDRDHLRQIRERYRTWPLEPDEEAALRFRADGLFRLTNLFSSLHWPDEALETARLCRATFVELGRRGVGSAGQVPLLQRSMRVERGLLADAGRLDEAIAAARADIETLAEGDGDPACDRYLAAAWGDLGAFEGRSGRHAEARAHLEQAVAMFDRLVAASPEDADLSLLSLNILHNAAITPPFVADPPARRALLTTLVERAGAGLERFPAQREHFGRGLLLGLAMQAHVNFEEGRPGESLEKARRRAALARRLAAETPQRRRFEEEVIGAALQILRCQSALGRPADAEAEIDEADALATRAVEEEPAVKQRTAILVDTLRAKAALCEATGRPAAVLAVQRRLLDAVLPWSKDSAVPEPFPVKVADVRAAIARLEGVADAPSLPAE